MSRCELHAVQPGAPVGRSSSPLRIVAYTKPEIFKPFLETGIALPYKRVVALADSAGRRIGQKAVSRLESHELELPSIVGRRVMASFQRATAGQPMNCHRFGRDIAGMISAGQEPLTDVRGLKSIGTLRIGAVGLVGKSDGTGVPHTIGCGLDDEALQVMSTNGEFGFAQNRDVVAYYQSHYLEQTIGLYELPPQQQTHGQDPFASITWA